MTNHVSRNRKKDITIRVKDKDKPKRREGPEAVTMKRRRSGPLHNRDRDVARGRSRKPKHRNQDRHMAGRVADRFIKNTEE